MSWKQEMGEGREEHKLEAAGGARRHSDRRLPAGRLAEGRKRRGRKGGSKRGQDKQPQRRPAHVSSPQGSSWTRHHARPGTAVRRRCFPAPERSLSWVSFLGRGAGRLVLTWTDPSHAAQCCCRGRWPQTPLASPWRPLASPGLPSWHRLLRGGSLHHALLPGQAMSCSPNLPAPPCGHSSCVFSTLRLSPAGLQGAGQASRTLRVPPCLTREHAAPAGRLSSQCARDLYPLLLLLQLRFGVLGGVHLPLAQGDDVLQAVGTAGTSVPGAALGGGVQWGAGERAHASCGCRSLTWTWQ